MNLGESSPTSTPSHYFESLKERFEQASLAAGGAVQMDCDIAGFGVRLRFANVDLLSALTPALAHSRTAELGERPLTIDIWDNGFAKGAIEPPPWRRKEPALLGSLDYYHDARFQMLYKHRSELWALDQNQDRAFYGCASPKMLTACHAAVPLRYLLHWWLVRRGFVFCHAAAVGLASGAVLIGGKSGSGKSTTALACLVDGLRFLGDDLTLVGPPLDPWVASVYSTAKLNADNLHRFPTLASRIHNAGQLEDEKALLYLAQWVPEQLAAKLPLRAIILPSIAERPASRLRPLSPAASLALLAPNTIQQLCGAEQATMELLASMVQRVPSFILEFGTDLAQAPKLIRGLLTANPTIAE